MTTCMVPLRRSAAICSTANNQLLRIGRRVHGSRATTVPALATRRRLATQVFSDTESVLRAWRHAVPATFASDTLAMYSSVLGGIVTDPALMQLPIDDHMVHRGHAVFDTCNVEGGRAYGLNFHLDRLIGSAAKAEIEAVPWSKEELRSIILDTIAAAGRPAEGEAYFVRYWLSAGRGNFNVSPAGCTSPSFYVAVHRDSHVSPHPGCAAVTVDVPLKPPLLATMKSNNYLLNALVAMQAERAGAALGVQSDGGWITESAVSCIGFVIEGTLVAPPFCNILASTTLRRAFELAPSLGTSILPGGVAQRQISLEEAKSAATTEMIDFGGGFSKPILSFDGAPVGNGQPGPVARGLGEMLVADFNDAENTDTVPW